MNITITINTDNASFEDGNEEQEVSRILRVLSENVTTWDDTVTLLDYNGNTVGECTIKH